MIAKEEVSDFSFNSDGPQFYPIRGLNENLIGCLGRDDNCASQQSRFHLDTFAKDQLIK